MSTQTHIDKHLIIEVTEAPGAINLHWRGRSSDREPGRFVVPILTEALQRAAAHRPLVLDFADIEYMNSSTFSPLVKMLDEAARRGIAVQVLYSATQKWQALSFAALKAFETGDGKITIRAR